MKLDGKWEWPYIKTRRKRTNCRYIWLIQHWLSVLVWGEWVACLLLQAENWRYWILYSGFQCELCSNYSYFQIFLKLKYHEISEFLWFYPSLIAFSSFIYKVCAAILQYYANTYTFNCLFFLFTVIILCIRTKATSQSWSCSLLFPTIPLSVSKVSLLVQLILGLIREGTKSRQKACQWSLQQVQLNQGIRIFK